MILKIEPVSREFERGGDPIASQLQQVDSRLRQELDRLCHHHRIIGDVMHAFFRSPGKKLRPGLVILSASVVRADQADAECPWPGHDRLINLAVITELVHSASLMHDDILDAAPTRRGTPSLNAEFGIKAAVLAGDMLYSHAIEMLATGFDSNIGRLLSQCVQRMTRGEICNLEDHDFEGYCSIIEDKTAAFMEFCCQAGATLADPANDKAPLVQALSRFGHHFGIIFQLTDDLVDQDDDVAMASQDRILNMLAEQVRGAADALSLLSPTVYKESLAGLLQGVLAKSPQVSDIADSLARRLAGTLPSERETRVS